MSRQRLLSWPGSFPWALLEVQCSVNLTRANKLSAGLKPSCGKSTSYAVEWRFCNLLPKGEMVNEEGACSLFSAVSLTLK